MDADGRSAPDACDAIELIKQDHRKAQMLFGDFEALRNRGELDDAAKQRLVRELCAELAAHAQVEEEIFYPAVREAVGDEAMVDAAEDEHAEARALIDRLCAMRGDDPELDATVVALAKAFSHHVQQEERDMLTAARGHVDAQRLGRQLEQRKEALLPRMRRQMAGD